jgi:hypothetical protein
MKCPVCGKEYFNQEELMGCLINHVQDSQKQQMDQVYRQNLMLMASQLTMASVATQTAARDVVKRFGEIYELLESLTKKPDVLKEIEKWLQDKDKNSSI